MVSCTVPSCESADFRWILTWEPNQEGNCLKALLRAISSPECASEGFRVVVYLVERAARETYAGQHSDTILVWLKAQLTKGGASAGGKLFYLQLELFCLQLSFFAYSPLRLLLEALSHCKQKSSNCK